jgi:alpha-tubulin suppressor-like RCC1 family protein
LSPLDCFNETVARTGSLEDSMSRSNTYGRSSVPAACVPAIAVLMFGCTDPLTFPGNGTSPPGDNNQTILSFQSVSVGSTHSCALANAGRALCWGSGGDLGDGTMLSRATPVLVEGPQRFGELDASSFTCGVTTNDVAWCWGTNESGRLGDGTTDYQPFPTRVSTGLRFPRITTGSVHTCGLTETAELWCWGSNRFSQLSTHPDTVSLVPIRVAPAQRFAVVDGGGIWTCAIDIAGSTWCWGDQYGPTPTETSGGPEFVTITLGGVHACGLTVDGEAYCFGSNTEGQLGNGTLISTPLGGPPVAVDTEERFVAISAGEFHTCAITAAGAGWCWGRDDVGQLGDGGTGGTGAKALSPVRVVTQNTFIAFSTISAGRFASCATTANGRAFCWGFGTGSASRPSSMTPVEVGS